MQPDSTAHVTGKRGLHAIIDNPAAVGCSTRVVPLTLDDGRKVLVPAELLIRQADGSYYLGLSPEDIGAAGPQPPPGEAAGVIPLIQERARIEKRRRQTGLVRVKTRTVEHEQVLREPLTHEAVEVQRVLVNQPVDAPPPVRREGDRIIIPLVQEVLVVERKLVVREEIHLTTRRTTEMYEQAVAVRREEADVQRAEEARNHEV
jgi:uncharacterized protein (TIGR02271 family)